MIRRSLFALLPLLAAVPALAQRRGPNGGLLAGSQGHEVELVLDGNMVKLYLIDHGRVAAPRAGAQARMVIQEGQASRTVQLTASGDAFAGTLDAPPASGARVVVTGRMPDGHTVQARYVMP
jgi:hypothetical protein